jgi:GNAT superfamily N-acetyltransferase
MKLVRWTRFTWDLSKLPPAEAALPAHFQVRMAGKEDQKAAREVIFRTFALDSVWSDTMKSFGGLLETHIDAAFGRSVSNVLVISHGPRIIAASLLSLEIDADNHLLSGPCVLAEYRSRGLGTALLHASLKLLQTAGLPKAHAVSKEMAPASKFVYRKFGSASALYDFEAALLEQR